MIRTVASLALCAALAIPAPALALSCLRPDVARDYQAADASSDEYIVVLGEMRFDTGLLPATDLLANGDRPDVEIPATFAGKSLSKDGFARDFEQEITLRVQCFGPWCGGATPEIPVLAFLKREVAGYVLERGPCFALSHDNPRPDQVRVVEQCFRGGPCEASED